MKFTNFQKGKKKNYLFINIYNHVNDIMRQNEFSSRLIDMSSIPSNLRFGDSSTQLLY